MRRLLILLGRYKRFRYIYSDEVHCFHIQGAQRETNIKKRQKMPDPGVVKNMLIVTTELPLDAGLEGLGVMTLDTELLALLAVDTADPGPP